MAAADPQIAASAGEVGAAPPLLVLQRCSRHYGETIALAPVSRALARGERLLLAGPNGAGKSTLLRILGGLVLPSAGQILAGDGTPLARRPDLRRALGYVGHRTQLYDALTAAENLRFVATLYAVDPARVGPQLDEVGLAGAADRRVGGFSRGMRQRLALARALLIEPALLLLDEPLSGLDPEGAEQVLALLDGWAADPTRTLVVASHDLARVRPLVRRVLVIDRGRASDEWDTDGMDGPALLARYREALSGAAR